MVSTDQDVSCAPWGIGLHSRPVVNVIQLWGKTAEHKSTQTPSRRTAADFKFVKTWGAECLSGTGGKGLASGRWRGIGFPEMTESNAGSRVTLCSATSPAPSGSDWPAGSVGRPWLLTSWLIEEGLGRQLSTVTSRVQALLRELWSWVLGLISPWLLGAGHHLPLIWGIQRTPEPIYSRDPNVGNPWAEQYWVECESGDRRQEVWGSGLWSRDASLKGLGTGNASQVISLEGWSWINPHNPWTQDSASLLIHPSRLSSLRTDAAIYPHLPLFLNTLDPFIKKKKENILKMHKVQYRK